jgi:radical SAM protein with 4Fe4S-binding SPASM domain
LKDTLLRPLLHSVMDRAAENLIPFQVSLELTHRCNLSCKHCYIDLPAKEELSSGELKDVLDQLAEAGAMYLLLTGGEPLMRSDFFDIAFYAKKRGFVIMLLTNGTLITPEVARDIEKLKPMFVGISIHGATASTHDGITGRQGSFVSVIRAVELLRNLAVKVSLHTLLMDSNIHEAEAMRELAGGIGVYLHVDNQLVPTRSGSLAPFQYRASQAELRQHSCGELVGGIKASSGANGICKAGRGTCSITPKGDVFPCLLMPLKIGNLRQTKFAEIWQSNPSPELTYLRSITWEDMSSCKNCNLIEYCQRCMGVAFIETGDLTKPAPTACRNAALRSGLFK